MAELIAIAALAGRDPLTRGGATLAPIDLGPITSVAVFPGGTKAVDAALKPLGVSFPKPGESLAKGDARITWTGPDQAFLSGVAPPDFTAAAAVTDQSGGWSALALSGDIAGVMARLCPLDFRITAFPPGRAARAQLQHMNAVFWREEERLVIFTFRSMAETAWGEVTHAMAGLAARARAGR